MKNRLLTLTVICLTSLLTFCLFLGFQKKEGDATAFQSIIANKSLSFRHLFISPEQLGVDAWEVGDYSMYRLETNMYSKTITFHVAAAGDEASHEKWLRTLGVININGADVEVWRLLNSRSIRPGSSKEEVLLAEGGIPFYARQGRADPYPVHLEYIGEADVTTAIGTFRCQHYFARFLSPDGRYEPVLELWANASVAPLGIVRARWQDEVLELVETREDYPFEVPEMLSEMMHTQEPQNAETQVGDSKSDCSTCHKGLHLKQDTLLAVSGEVLDVTEALHHYRHSALFDSDDLLGVRLKRRRGQPPASDEIRFTWEKGSFRVKSGSTGQFAVSLDEIAHNGHIHITADKNRLIFYPAIKRN